MPKVPPLGLNPLAEAMRGMQPVVRPLEAVPHPAIEAALRIPSPAESMYERIVRSIAEFEEDLKPDEEIGARLVSFGQGEVIHVLDVGYWGPDLITFEGTNADGRPVRLLQHISQISVLLVALPVEKGPPRRIGFDLVKKLDPASGEEA